MEIKINLRDAALVVCGVAAGLFASSALINKAKKDIKKEVIAETTKTVKKDITDEIKNGIKFNDLAKEIKNDLDKEIVNDILEESKNKMNQFISIVNEKLDAYDNDIEEYKEKVTNAIFNGILLYFGNFSI